MTFFILTGAQLRELQRAEARSIGRSARIGLNGDVVSFGSPKICVVSPDAKNNNLEEVMDYRTFCCASAKPSAKPAAALVLNLKVKKECKMDLPGRNVGFGALFPPMVQREIPTRFLH